MIDGFTTLSHAFIRFFMSALLVVAVAPCPTTATAQDVVDRIVAVVNGELITLFELNQRFRPVLEQVQGRELVEEEKRQLLLAKRQLLQHMVDETLLRQEAERLNMTVSDLEVQNQMRQVREGHGLTEAQFLEQIRLQGMTREAYEKELRDEIQRQRLIGFMIRRKVVVTTDEIKRHYESRQGDFLQQHRVHLALIVFGSRELAEDVLARMRLGELTFESAAQNYSQGPGAQQGGDIGILTRKDIAPELQSALAGLKVGNFSDIFLFQGRPAVLKLLDEDVGEILPLDEVKDRIREQLMAPLLEERFNTYLEELRGRALIDIRL